jgi:hypothetical protein
MESRTIKIGIKSEIMAEVKEGLLEKEQVVIRGVTVKGANKSALSARKGP